MSTSSDLSASPHLPGVPGVPAAAPDPIACARQRRRLQGAHDVPWLNEEVARRLDSKLDWMKMQPASWVDWAPTWGGGSALVATRYPQALHGRLDPWTEGQAADQKSAGLKGLKQTLQQWWTGQGQRLWTLADVDRAPWAEAGAQMLWANMSLHAATDVPATLRQWHAQLAPQGFLMCSALGPDTLRELRTLYAKHGWGLPTMDFIDMHDLGDELVKAGFADPVMDMERIQLTWASPEAMLAELRTWGGNVATGRFVGCRSRAWQRAFLHAVGKELRDPDGRIRLTVEVIYGHAIKPEPRVPLQAETRVSLQDMRRMVQRRDTP
jgi:malonyl-CoA O-methyltransferase